MNNIKLNYNELDARVARVDDLGRIVIPTDMRKNLNLKTGGPLNLVVAADENNQPVLLGMQYGSMLPFERQCSRLLDNLVTLSKGKGFGPSIIRIYDDAEHLVASAGTYTIRTKNITETIEKAVHELLSDAGLDNIHSVFEPGSESDKETAVFATSLRDQFTGETLGVLVLADTNEVVETLQMAVQYAAISFDGRRD